jgi:hypothetical protein
MGLPSTKTLLDPLSNVGECNIQPDILCSDIIVGSSVTPALTTPVPLMKTLDEPDWVDCVVGNLHFFPVP